MCVINHSLYAVAGAVIDGNFPTNERALEVTKTRWGIGPKKRSRQDDSAVAKTVDVNDFKHVHFRLCSANVRFWPIADIIGSAGYDVSNRPEADIKDAMNFSFATDTATLCVFDLEALRHRLHDSADWWTLERDEVAEVNAGNVAFFGLGSDGVFDLVVMGNATQDAKRISLGVPSGRLFIGAAEEVTSAGLEPEGLRGKFFEVDPGKYVVAASRSGSLLTLGIFAGGDAKNAFIESVSLA